MPQRKLSERNSIANLKGGSSTTSLKRQNTAKTSVDYREELEDKENVRSIYSPKKKINGITYIFRQPSLPGNNGCCYLSITYLPRCNHILKKAIWLITSYPQF
jgi:hypothetical protein